MKKIFMLLALLVTITATAQVEISRTERANPDDDVFMDMAVSVAQTSVAQGYKPCGAVVILNGAWRASGMPVGGKTAEQDALARTRRTTVPTASVYTVNEPTTEALDAMRAASVSTVYYVNPREDVISAGIYDAADYAPSQRDDLPQIKVVRIDYDPARALVGKN